MTAISDGLDGDLEEVLTALPEGVEHFKNWLTPQEAQELFNFADDLTEWDNYSAHPEKPGKGAQDVAWAGIKWNKDSTLSIVGDGSLPPLLEAMADRIEQEFGFRPTQFQINRFLPGRGVTWHSDINPAKPVKGDGKTAAFCVGAPRVQLFRGMPPEWVGYKHMLPVDNDPTQDFEPEFELELEDGDCTVLSDEFQRHNIHAIVDKGSGGVRYSFVGRGYVA